jgi:hypothetical protein
MERAELERMSIEELRRQAGARGIGGAASLGRDALIDALDPELRRGGRLDVPSSTFMRGHEHDTETMARLYLAQGLPDLAAEIYRKLLAREPENGNLRARLAEAEAAMAGQKRAATQAREQVGTTKVPQPAPGEPFGMLDFEELPDGYGVDECELIARDPFHLFAYWEVTDGGLDLARSHLGDEAGSARLVLRVFTITAGVAARDTRDHALDGNRGRRYLPTPRPGAQVRAAVGLVASSGLFAPIAHSSTVRVPHVEPAPPSAVTWMEVEPASGRVRERQPPRIIRGPGAEGHAERALPGSAVPGAPAAGVGSSGGGPGSSPGKWRPGSGSGAGGAG